jgi:hypothetical protein
VTTLDILGETPTEQMEADVMRHTANPMCEVESSTGAPAVRGQTKLGELELDAKEVELEGEGVNAAGTLQMPPDPEKRQATPYSRRQPQQRGDPGTREYMQ